MKFVFESFIPAVITLCAPASPNWHILASSVHAVSWSYFERFVTPLSMYVLLVVASAQVQNGTGCVAAVVVHFPCRLRPAFQPLAAFVSPFDPSSAETCERLYRVQAG